MRSIRRSRCLCALAIGGAAVALALPSCGATSGGGCEDRATCPDPEAGAADGGASDARALDVTDALPADAVDSALEGAAEGAAADVAGEASPDGTALDAGGDVVPEAADAGSDSADGASDAGDGSPACNPSNPFGAAVMVAGLFSTSSEGSLRLTADELTGFFWSSRPGGPGPINLYVAARVGLAAPFVNIALLTSVNGPASQYDPTVTADGLTLAFGSNRAGAGAYDLYAASRVSTAVDFSGVTALAALDTPSNEVQPFLMPDGAEIYFSSDRSGDYDLYRSRMSGGQFPAPTAVVELNVVAVADEHPVLSPDGLTMVFSSTRAGGAGSNDIWVAERTSTATTFGAPVNLGSVNSAGKDIPDWLSADRCRLYFHSDRSGAEHVWVATRP